MQKQILFAMLIGVVGTFGYIAYTIAIRSAEPRPDSYRAAVVRVLDVRRVDYRDVEVLDSCAPSYQVLPNLRRNRTRAGHNNHRRPDRMS
jgi:hypothetical protein